MAGTAGYTEIRRATERLRGILQGIAIDGRINEIELRALEEWLSMHPSITSKEPFSTVVESINQVIDDNYMDEETHDDLLDLCLTFDDNSMVNDISKSVIGVLHGVLQGIAADKKVNVNEVIGLKNWLEVHCHLKDYWPVCEVWDMVSRILADGVVDENEKAELLAFCKNFSEIPVKTPILRDEIYKQLFMKSNAPVLLPVTAICDRGHQIAFEDRSFCFTGPARSGKRSDLCEIVVSMGGIPKNNVVTSLDYLVIGAQSSPAWFFSTYGRKIEKVMNLKIEKQAKTVILYEDDFINQAN